MVKNISKKNRRRKQTLEYEKIQFFCMFIIISKIREWFVKNHVNKMLRAIVWMTIDIWKYRSNSAFVSINRLEIRALQLLFFEVSLPTLVMSIYRSITWMPLESVCMCERKKSLQKIHFFIIDWLENCVTDQVAIISLKAFLFTHTFFLSLFISLTHSLNSSIQVSNIQMNSWSQLMCVSIFQKLKNIVTKGKQLYRSGSRFSISACEHDMH